MAIIPASFASFGANLQYLPMAFPVVGNDMNTSTGRWMAAFRADRSESMTGFHFYFGSNTGTPVIVPELYALDANGEPTGSVLATISGGFTPTASSMNDKTWDAAYSLTSGTEYGVVFSNTAGTPGSNFARGLGIAYGCWADNFAINSVDSGSSWNAPSAFMSYGFRPKYATSGTVGASMAIGSNVGGSLAMWSDGSTRQARHANLYNFARAITLWGILINSGRNVTGSPTHDICAEVSSASLSLATSDSLINLGNGTNAGRILLFGSGVAIPASTDRYIGITTSPVGSSAGTSGNYTTEAACNGGTSTPSVISSNSPFRSGHSSTNYASGGTVPSWSSANPLNISLLYTVDVGGSSVPIAGNMRGGFIN